jgi:branched-subunit amino acid aminotransferase/4-amino-4-deoxychorismate lyase
LINGKMARLQRLYVFDRLNYGDGLFETMKATCGKPLFLKEHLKRLLKSAKALRMDPAALAPFVEAVDIGAIQALLRKNRLDKEDASVKLLVTRGVDKGGHLPSKDLVPTAVIVTKRIDAQRLAGLKKKGCSAITVESPSPALPGVKSLNYLSSVLARISAEKRGAFEALFSHNGLITEGSSTNIFVVKGGLVTTPPLGRSFSTGPLPGVIRGEIIKLARRNSIHLSEVQLTTETLIEADEAFLTNSISGVVPLVRVNGSRIGAGRPGPMTARLQRLLEALEEGA